MGIKTETIEIPELPNKYFKAVIVKIFKLSIINMLETNENRKSLRNRMSQQRNR